MTEQEWLGCGDTDEMLDFLHERTSERKFRLFGCACYRRHADILKEYKWAAKALEAAEKLADGRITQGRFDSAASRFDAAEEEEDLDGAADIASTALWHLMGACKAIEGSAWHKGKAAARCIASAAAEKNADARQEDRAAEVQVQVRLVRCIFNPFHSVTLAPSHRTNDVISLARAAYDERHLPSGELDSHRLAVLADALEEAGCDHTSILDHLRSPGPHVRGCWPVDLCLGLT